MANYATLRAAIAAVIKQNGNNEITGSLLQQQLLAMVNSLGGGFQYAGFASPSFNPGTPDMNLFYIASTAGTYANFNGLVVAENEFAILKYNGNWSKDSIEVASPEKVNELQKEIYGGRDVMATANGNGTDQFFNRGDVGYPMTQLAQYVYLHVKNPASNFETYGMGVGNNGTLERYANVEWLDQQNGYGRITITSLYNQIVITSAVSSGTVVEILSSVEEKSIDEKFTEVHQVVESLTENVSELSNETALLKQSIDGGRVDIQTIRGTGANQYFNLANLGYPESGNCIVYFRVTNPASNFSQYGLGQGNNGELLNYRDVTWDDEANGLGHVNIQSGFSQFVITSAVSSGSTVTVLSVDVKESFDSQFGELRQSTETQSADINAVNGRITGGETVLRTMTGNGSDQIIPLSTLGMKRPKVYLYFRVVGQASNFDQYGLGYSNDGKTLASYTNVTWVNQEEGYGYIVVLNKNYIVLTSANNSGVSIRFLDVSWNPGIEKQVLALNQRVFGGHRVVFSIEGNGTDQFIKLDDYGITPDENGRYYIKVENPLSNFNQYGIASSDDGATLKQYRSSTDDGDEKYFSCDTPYVAVTSAVKIGTIVSFYSRYEDGVGAIYSHPAIVSFIDDDSGKYVPEIWGQILTQSPIRMGFACITGFMSGLSAPEIYEQMTPAQLKALYDEGHEVYSHSYTHPAFYESSVTVDQISDQCRRSKDWLLANGYFRGSDIIVYPGGLGDGRMDKENVVRRFYKYGVDTTGFGVNEEPLIDRLRVKRFNADTATLAELEAKVDEAIATGHLLVFMNHAYELNRDKEAQIAKMVSIIEYIKATSAIILPLGEALNQIYGI